MTLARWFEKEFRTSQPLIGVVHLAPLPGSPASALSVERIQSRAVADARRYVDAGFDGLLVENFGDCPFRAGAVEPHSVAIMTRVALAIREVAGRRPVGVNVLRNDGLAALAVAVAAGLAFIRVNVLAGVAVTDQGLIQGDAARLLRYRRALGCRARIFADFDVKHASYLRRAPVAVAVEELVGRALADAVLVTGPATGAPPDVETLRQVRRPAGTAPVLVASGTTGANIGTLAELADGFIVGTWVKSRGRTASTVDPARASALVHQLSGLRPPRRKRTDRSG